MNFPILLLIEKTMDFAKVESLTPLDIEASSMPLLSPPSTTATKRSALNSTSKNIFLWYVFQIMKLKAKCYPSVSHYQDELNHFCDMVTFIP